jgi:hypothetical protein
MDVEWNKYVALACIGRVYLCKDCIDDYLIFSVVGTRDINSNNGGCCGSTPFSPAFLPRILIPYQNGASILAYQNFSTNATQMGDNRGFIFDVATLQLSSTLPAFQPPSPNVRDVYIDPITNEIYVTVFYADPVDVYYGGSYLHIFNADGSYKNYVYLPYTDGEGLSHIATNETHIWMVYQGGYVNSGSIYLASLTDINLNNRILRNDTIAIGTLALDAATGWLYFPLKGAFQIWRLHTQTGQLEMYSNVLCPYCDVGYDGPLRIRIIGGQLCAFPRPLPILSPV